MHTWGLVCWGPPCRSVSGVEGVNEAACGDIHTGWGEDRALHLPDPGQWAGPPGLSPDLGVASPGEPQALGHPDALERNEVTARLLLA